MKTSISLKACLFFLLAVILAMGAGFLNGLTGTGAGILFLLLFRMAGGSITKDTFVSSMSCVIPLSAFSLFTYPMPEMFSFAAMATAFLTATAGGICGAFLQQKLNIGVLKKIFALLVIYSGIRMLL